MIKLKTALVVAGLTAATTFVAAAPLVEQTKDYQIEDVAYQSELIKPETALGGGVLLVPDWTGINEHARMQARHLAQAGRVVLIVDLYGKAMRPKTDAEAQAASQPMIENRLLARKRMQAALNALKTELPHESSIASVGFSFGALAALELARGGSDIAGTVALWPVLNNPQPQNAASICAPVLVLQGTQDALSPLASVEAFAKEMDAAAKPYTVKLYGGVRHGFTLVNIPAAPGNPLASDPKAAADALLQTDAFLKQVLSNPGGNAR